MRFFPFLYIAPSVLCTAVGPKRGLELDAGEESPKRLMTQHSVPFSASDAVARATYLSEDYSLFEDPLGSVLRMQPAERLWRAYAELVPASVFPENFIQLDQRPIGESEHSKLYGLKSHNSWVIKYHAFCPSEFEPTDSILRESYFLGLVNSRAPHITHKLKYMSGPYYPKIFSSIKLPFKAGIGCPADGSVPVVRFLITERVGISLWGLVDSFPDEKVDFTLAIELGIEIFALLQELHAINIVHGDVHPGNIAFRGSDRTSELILIDFGRARIGTRYPASFARSPRPLCHGYNSPWESIYGSDYPYTFRDDIFRVFLVVAAMIHGSDHKFAQENICEGKNAGRFLKYLAFKNDVNIFDTDIGTTEFRLLPHLPRVWKSHASRISDLLLRGLNYARELSYEAEIDYAYLAGILEDILDLT